MVRKVNSSKALYAVSKASSPALSIAPTFVIGRDYINAHYGSSRKTGGVTCKMKGSRIAKAADKILTGSVSAIFSKSGHVYAEIDGHPWLIEGEAPLSVYTTFTTEAPTHILMMVLLAISTGAVEGFEETKAVFDNVAMAYSADRVVQDDLLAYLCDAFYEDAKATFGGPDYDLQMLDYDSTKKSEVEQGFRSHFLKHASSSPIIPEISKNISSSFTLVTLPDVIEEGIAGTEAEEWFQKCKDGMFEIGYDWSEEQLRRVRPTSFLERFIPNEAHKVITTLADYSLNNVVDRMNMGKEGIEAIGDDYLNLILVGKPGTGKTTCAEALSATLGLPIYTVPITKNTEEDEMQGKTKVVKGALAFKSTPFLEAFEHGGIVVLEEFNLADPAMMQGALGQAIEYPFVLYKDGYEEVHRHPLCVVISTMNTATQGAREPNEALTSRSPISIIMDDPKEDEFVGILCAKGYSKKNSKAVYKAYNIILNYLKDEAGSEEMALSITLRHCIGALRLLKAGFDFNSAIRMTMIGAIAIRDVALADEVFKSCIESKRFVVDK